MHEQKAHIFQHKRVRHILDDIPILLRNFPPGDFRDFLILGTLEEYNTNDVILNEMQEPPDSGWLVTDGEISIYKEDTYIGKFRYNDFIGETFIFKKAAPPGTLVATAPSALLRFNRQEVLQYFEQRSDRLFKLFIMNLVDLQSRKLVYAGKKIMHLQNKIKQLEDV